VERARVGIIGSGMVGRALARGFAGRGHDVRIGSRDPDKLAGFAAEAGVGTGIFADVAEHGELVVLATLGAAAEEAVALAGPQRLAGKVVIDTTNPLAFSGGQPGMFVGWDDSLGERLQRAAPEARVVKCFNIVSAPAMIDPSFEGGPPDMFIAGDDPAAKATVTELLDDFGWPSVIDTGGIEGARLLEPLTILWVIVGQRRGSWDHAFKVVAGS
jgi:predicted dinucleotide-binding enzyme